MIGPSHNLLGKLENNVKPKLYFFAIAVTLFGMEIATARADNTIVIVRHGEKPAEGMGQLNCRGLNRSLALAPILLARYGKPTAIYAPNPAIRKKDNGVPYAYVRPLATIEPLAIRAGMPVNVSWGMTDIQPLAVRLLASPAGTQIVAWEHHWAESLAKRLLSILCGNPKDVPRWEDSDFDSVFVIRTTKAENGAAQVTFSHEHEGLNGASVSCGDQPPPSSAQ